MREAEPATWPPSVKLTPFFRHCQVKGEAPKTAALNCALVPTTAVWLDGWTLICGAEVRLKRKMEPLP
jgi:hypothetical protein